MARYLHQKEKVSSRGQLPDSNFGGIKKKKKSKITSGSSSSSSTIDLLGEEDEDDEDELTASQVNNILKKAEMKDYDFRESKQNIGKGTEGERLIYRVYDAEGDFEKQFGCRMVNGVTYKD